MPPAFYIYPLKDPAPFVAALGDIDYSFRGWRSFDYVPPQPADSYNHAQTTVEAAIPDGAEWVDVWLVTSEGDLHPNMSEPIQVHREDLHLDQGRPIRKE